MPADVLLSADEVEQIRQADGDHEIEWVDDDIACGVTVHQILDAYEALRGILAEVIDVDSATCECGAAQPVRWAMPEDLRSRAEEAARGAGGRGKPA